MSRQSIGHGEGVHHKTNPADRMSVKWSQFYCVNSMATIVLFSTEQHAEGAVRGTMLAATERGKHHGLENEG